MARIFITGSADGLGRMAAELLIEQGHRVVLHARSQARADEAKRNVPEAEAVVIGDLPEGRWTQCQLIETINLTFVSRPL